MSVWDNKFPMFPGRGLAGIYFNNPNRKAY